MLLTMNMISGEILFKIKTLGGVTIIGCWMWIWTARKQNKDGLNWKRSSPMQVTTNFK